MTPAEIDIVRRHAAQAFHCGRDSIHGPHHWQNVEKNGLAIAPETGADVETVQLFAVLHDCCRESDGVDPGHGPRAAELTERLARDGLLRLAPGRLDALVFAIRHHADGKISDDSTIGTCWDADRLDLGRAGIIPKPDRMSTPAGKKVAALGSLCLYLKKGG